MLQPCYCSWHWLLLLTLLFHPFSIWHRPRRSALRELQAGPSQGPWQGTSNHCSRAAAQATVTGTMQPPTACLPTRGRAGPAEATAGHCSLAGPGRLRVNRGAPVPGSAEQDGCPGAAAAAAAAAATAAAAAAAAAAVAAGGSSCCCSLQPLACHSDCSRATKVTGHTRV